MPLQNYQYDTIMREYNRRQARNRRIQEEHLAEAYEKIPRLREIDEEVATLSARKARALISRQEVGIEDLRNDIALLSQERTALLLSSGYPADYLEMSYTCPLCQDTGYIGSQKCSCFKKAEIEFLYTQSNLKEILEKENFDHFSFDFYSDTITNDSMRLHVARIRWRRNLSLTLIILSRTCFSTATQVWARPFFPTASLTIFWTVHTVYFIFLHSSFLIFLQALLFPEAATLPMMNRFLTVTC